MAKRIFILVLGLTSLFFTSTTIYSKYEEPSPVLTPAEEMATFQVEPGMKVQLVAAEPMVQEPVVITFDEDGRLWVVEMRGFMPTIEGEGENQPVGRVSVLEDLNGDGQMDKSTIYLDSLIMPRALAVVQGGALIAENNSLWMTEDLDGDLQADTKTLVDSDYAANGLPEHSDNGLWRSVDNWYYNAKSRFRYKLVNGEWQRDSTEFRGQWGLSHDNEGRLYYNYNWSQLHADLVPPNYLSRNANHTPTSGIDEGLTLDRRIYPIRDNPAVNRGYIPGTLDEAGKLLEFTAACSPLVYRGTAFLSEYQENVFVCEPAGNLVKRNVVTEDGLLLSAYDPHPGQEFLASTDERFRPVHLATGPDGSLYVADMYRGIIQHGAYMTPYLKEQTQQRKLDQSINRGRIWRVVPQNWQAPEATNLSELASEELVPYLSHADGWYRDMAQRLLVERRDVGAIPALEELAKNSENYLAQFHALWTLEGLKATDSELLFSLLSEGSSLVRTTALQLLEPLAEEESEIQQQLAKKLLSNSKTSPIELSLQMALSASQLAPNFAYPLLTDLLIRYDTSALIRDAVLSSLQDQEYAFTQYLRQHSHWQASSPARKILLETLTTAIVNKGSSEELIALLSDLGTNQSLDWQEQAIVNGLSVQGIQESEKLALLPEAPKVITRTHPNITPTQQQAIASLFSWPGHTVGSDDLPKQNRLGEKAQRQFALGRQHYLTTCAGCHGNEGEGISRFAPPLVSSDWVLGDQKRLALLLLHGLEGPVKVGDKIYDAPDILPVMPAHSTMGNTELTAVMNYIRNAWGNQADPVSGGLVGTTRHTSQGRVVPWTAKELNQHIQELPTATNQ